MAKERGEGRVSRRGMPPPELAPALTPAPTPASAPEPPVPLVPSDATPSEARGAGAPEVREHSIDGRGAVVKRSLRSSTKNRPECADEIVGIGAKHSGFSPSMSCRPGRAQTETVPERRPKIKESASHQPTLTYRMRSEPAPLKRTVSEAVHG